MCEHVSLPKKLFEHQLQQTLVIFLIYLESIFLLKNILTSLENHLIIIGLMEEELPKATKSLEAHTRRPFPALPPQRPPYREIHRGAWRSRPEALAKSITSSCSPKFECEASNARTAGWRGAHLPPWRHSGQPVPSSRWFLCC